LCNLWKLAERDRLVLLIVKGEKRPACGISFGAVSKAGNGNGEGGRGRESYRGNLQSYYTKTESEEKRKEGVLVGVGKQPSRPGRLHQQQSQLSEDGEDRKLRCI
jgi:hypothetical protein